MQGNGPDDQNQACPNTNPKPARLASRDECIAFFAVFVN